MRSSLNFPASKRFLTKPFVVSVEVTTLDLLSEMLTTILLEEINASSVYVYSASSPGSDVDWFSLF